MPRSLAAPLFGQLPLRAVSAELVDAYRAHLVAKGRLEPRTINKYLLVLHAIFRRAQRHFGRTSCALSKSGALCLKSSGTCTFKQGQVVEVSGPEAGADEPEYVDAISLEDFRLTGPRVIACLPLPLPDRPEAPRCQRAAGGSPHDRFRAG